jgi:O-antigen/teichoic acid export membrane protein
MKNIIKEEAKEVRGIFGRIKRGDLKGNSGQAIKNSSYQLAVILVAKTGSLLFAIIIARLMLPELYGLYGLALSTILFIGVFSDMGLGAALNTFLSKTIDRFPGKARGYFKYITKWRIMLSIFSILLLLVLTKWLATTYYQKPIYYALLAGIIYLPAVILQAHLVPLFISSNNFKPLLIGEVILQFLKLTIIPLLIIFLLIRLGSTEIYLFGVFIALAICYLLTSGYLYWKIKKNKKLRESKIIEISNKEKKDLKKFILPLTVTALSGVVFGYIDQIMLGRYVESAFLGFYQASFNLVTSAAAIVAFSSIALFPILARLRGKTLERGFIRSRNITVLISVLAAILTFILSPFIINIIYGPMYSTATTYLRIFSILIITFPLISLYTTYYTSQKRTKIISTLLIISTTVNIFLNYFFIQFGLNFGMSYAVMGAGVATIISRVGYLGGLILFRK